MSRPSDRNLLFGILALQMDFISRDALIAAMHAWLQEKTKPLGQILLEQGAMRADTHALLEPLVQKHLELHANDSEQSLAALSSIGSVREELSRVNDGDVQASLAQVSAAREVNDDPFATNPETAGTPTSTGLRFLILRPHRKGGLGEVFIARDQELPREVALKQIQDRFADESSSRKRFLREAEITGALEHPGIVPIYGLGTYAGGRPFYAMRFVRGDSLQDAIRRFHGAGPALPLSGERSLEFRKLLGRLVDVCNAMEYAHSRGVLHRDLKPGNIMLGKYGETLVVDWGLAKPLGRVEGKDSASEPPLRFSANAEDVETMQGSALGTPEFMSPEQAAGRLDRLGPASDVYSLGATLYSLLTGREPFDRQLQEPPIAVRIEQGDFPRPRAVHASVPAALEAICLQAMARQPEARYPSPGAMAEDIEHWLADEPVAAYQETLRAQVARWVRRHETFVGTAAALLTTAVIALAIGMVTVNRERRITATERDLKERALEAEARRSKEVREACDAMSSPVIEDWLNTKKPTALQPEQKTFLQNALNLYERFASEMGEDEQARAGVAAASQRVGVIRQNLGQSRDAEAAFQRSQQLYQDLVRDFPATAGYQSELAHTINYLGSLLEHTNRREQAEQAYRECLRIRKDLVARYPPVALYRADLAVIYSNLGNLLGDTQRLDEAEKMHREALVLRKQLADEFPAEREYQRRLAFTYHDLGLLTAPISPPEQTEKLYREALRIRQALAERYPTHPDYRNDLAYTQNQLAIHFAETNRLDEAKKAYRSAAAVWQELANRYPAVIEYRKQLALCHNNQSTVLLDTDGPAEAEKAARKAIALGQELVDDVPAFAEHRHLLGQAYSNLGIALVKQDRKAEAESSFRQALDLLRKLHAEDPLATEYAYDLSSGYLNLGDVLVELKRLPEAESNYDACLALRKKLLAESPNNLDYQNDLAVALGNLANIRLKRQDARSALPLLDEALAYLQSALRAKPDQPYYQESFRQNRFMHGEAFLQLGHHAQAAQQAEELAKLNFKPDMEAYNAACLLARCAPVAQNDASLSATSRHQASQDYADRALALLRRAIAKGFADVEQMKKDEDLESLRGRKEFQQLVAELEANAKKKPEGK